MKVLFSDDVLPRGKHKGKTVGQALEEDPEYIKRFNNTGSRFNKLFNQFCISDEVLNGRRILAVPFRGIR